MSIDEDLTRLTRRLRLAQGECVAPARWCPAADVLREPTGWRIRLELAGVDLADVLIQTRGRWLLIRGRRRDRTLYAGCDFQAMEIVYSEFERLFELPANLERARIATEYTRGMLLVTITPEVEGT
jgi:HSP20 family molecular chaperone IbpA